MNQSEILIHGCCLGADAAGHARVADMGLARRLEPGAAANLTGETGTYYYMAPEMFRHEVRTRGSRDSERRCVASSSDLVQDPQS